MAKDGKKGGEAPKEDYLGVHEKRHYYARKISDTHVHHSYKGFVEAVDTHLKKGGEVDFDLLDQESVQKAFAKTMTDFYVKKIEEVCGSKIKDDFHRDLMLRAYQGMTYKEIEGLVGKYGKRLNYSLFPRVAESMNKRIRDGLYDTAAEHIEEGHVPEITKKLGLEGKLSQVLTLKEARDLLNEWRDHGGSLSDITLREMIGEKLKRAESPAPVGTGKKKQK